MSGVEICALAFQGSFCMIFTPVDSLLPAPVQVPPNPSPVTVVSLAPALRLPTDVLVTAVWAASMLL